VLVFRQADDFMFGGESEPSLRRLEKLIGKDVDFLVTSGLVEHYNGIEVVQARDYIHIHDGPYVDKILNNHGLDTYGKDENLIIEQVQPSVIKEIETSEGPDDPVAAKSIATEDVFKYQTVIGDSIFAYVTCRLDIGYAIADLSNLSTHPIKAHYAAVKCVFCYLCQMRTYGLIYWRLKPLDALSYVSFPHLRPLDEVDRKMPMPSSIGVMCGYLDSAHANLLRTRWSVGAHVFCLAGTSIAYRARWIAAICLSSTYCEFVTAVGSAKVSKFLRDILFEISIHQLEATELYEDNAAARMMANDKRPIDRSRHIDIQHFSLQEWVAKGEEIFHHIWGTIDPDDALTKALGWLFHHRHSTRVMGMCGSPYLNTLGRVG
jgi:hypothetical protein